MPVTCAISTSERPPLCWPVLSAIAPTVWEPWGKAGQQSLMRSALAEAAAQFARALDQSATLPATPVLRRKQIKLQVGLIY